MQKPPLIYFCDPVRRFGERMRRELQSLGYETALFRSINSLLEAVRQEMPNVIFKPHRPPELASERGLLEQLSTVAADVQVVVVQERPDVREAIQAVRRGAFDCITEDAPRAVLEKTLRRALEQQSRTAADFHILSRLHAFTRPDILAGTSQAMRRVKLLISQVAETDVSVLIQGESGTGKELVARLLHERSRRSTGPFVAVNSAALADSMIESELFGHVKGAFTGAMFDKPGRFALAEGGTLFLDEIGDLSPKGQADLLRVLEDRMFRPLGSREMQRADVRFVTATNRDLETACAQGTFREDLLYRINVITIYLPPLRERTEDIAPLAQQFLRHFCSRHHRPEKHLSPAAIEALIAFPWPGNVRQLRNAIEQTVLLSRRQEIQPADLPRWLFAAPAGNPQIPAGEPGQENIPTLAEVEAAHVRKVLAMCDGNRTEAARLLGISRRALHYKLQRLDEASASREQAARARRGKCRR